MARIIFETFQDYNDAKLSELETIAIGSPIFETDAEGLLTGRFIVDHQFTSEQLAELEKRGLRADFEGITSETAITT